MLGEGQLQEMIGSLMRRAARCPKVEARNGPDAGVYFTLNSMFRGKESSRDSRRRQCILLTHSIIHAY